MRNSSWKRRLRFEQLEQKRVLDAHGLDVDAPAPVVQDDVVVQDAVHEDAPVEAPDDVTDDGTEGEPGRNNGRGNNNGLGNSVRRTAHPNKGVGRMGRGQGLENGIITQVSRRPRAPLPTDEQPTDEQPTDEQPTDEQPTDSRVAQVSVEVSAETITITSTKDLSNVVYRVDGIDTKLDGLEGHTLELAAVEGITDIWVKSGANHSGDGPGYGQRFTATDGGFEAAEPLGEDPHNEDPQDEPGRPNQNQGRLAEITVGVDEQSGDVSITSTKDISNVVYRVDGVDTKIDGLEGHEYVISGVAGITDVWVKSGANHSGDGPGYGEHFAVEPVDITLDLATATVDSEAATVTVVATEAIVSIVYRVDGVDFAVDIEEANVTTYVLSDVKSVTDIWVRTVSTPIEELGQHIVLTQRDVPEVNIPEEEVLVEEPGERPLPEEVAERL